MASPAGCRVPGGAHVVGWRPVATGSRRATRAPAEIAAALGVARVDRASPGAAQRPGHARAWTRRRRPFVCLASAAVRAGPCPRRALPWRPAASSALSASRRGRAPEDLSAAGRLAVVVMARERAPALGRYIVKWTTSSMSCRASSAQKSSSASARRASRISKGLTTRCSGGRARVDVDAVQPPREPDGRAYAWHRDRAASRGRVADRARRTPRASVMLA